MSNRPRPVSPHLQVYRWQITMVMSILFRASGIVLTFGAFVLAWWLLAVAAGGETYARAADLVDSPLGLIALFGFSLAAVYHLLNGLRHLAWDSGMGLDIPEVYRSGYVVIALTLVLTALIWIVALGGGA
ncbi:MAG TPA: succinate dehydrogenase, cytochrome b556 subunit [Luteimonas sp.]|nr:succinate dehydrogenase, cytochrome b556 subunit [Luteimonas sp.]